jgi:hypothetical protein
MDYPSLMPVRSVQPSRDRVNETPADAVVVPRLLSKKTPRQHLCNDKGYDYPEIRRSAARRGYFAHIKARGVRKLGFSTHSL